MCGKAEGVWWWVGSLGGFQGQTPEGLQAPRVFGQGTFWGAPFTTVHPRSHLVQDPLCESNAPSCFSARAGTPLPQGKAPPCSTQGPGPPFPGSETDSTTDRGRKHQFAQADQATCTGGLGSKSAEICRAVDCTDSSA